jgi:hypothetical protein
MYATRQIFFIPDMTHFEKKICPAYLGPNQLNLLIICQGKGGLIFLLPRPAAFYRFKRSGAANAGTMFYSKVTPSYWYQL